MSKANRKAKRENQKPDFEDPFAPNIESNDLVHCLHCNAEYPEKEIKWANGFWCCKNYPSCNGAGKGWDIFPVREFKKRDLPSWTILDA